MADVAGGFAAHRRQSGSRRASLPTMAVLVEAISVIVRRDSIEAKYPGRWAAFVYEIQNQTLCFDEQIARLGFMSPPDAEAFVEKLKQRRLVFLNQDKAIDLAIVDQQLGVTTQCDWLEFGKIGFGDEGKVSACSFFDGPRVAAGVHFRGTSMQLATPVDWRFAGSLSQKSGSYRLIRSKTDLNSFDRKMVSTYCDRDVDLQIQHPILVLRSRAAHRPG